MKKGLNPASIVSQKVYDGKPVWLGFDAGVPVVRLCNEKGQILAGGMIQKFRPVPHYVEEIIRAQYRLEQALNFL